MKKNLLSLASLVCLVGLVSLTSCKKDVASDGSQFKATTERCSSRDSKIALDGIDIKWVGGDQIAVYGTAGGGIFAAEPNTSAVTAVFNNVSGAIGDGPYRAFYPDTMTTDGEHVVLPTTQTSPDGSLTALPMYAESNTNVLAFKNLCGVLKLHLTKANTTVTSITILTPTSFINGTYSIDNSGAHPVLVYQSDGTHSITLNLTTPQSIDEGADFYIYMPAGCYGMKIIINSDDNRYCVKTSNVSIDVERSQYSSIEFDDEDMDFVCYSSDYEFYMPELQSSWHLGAGSRSNHIRGDGYNYDSWYYNQWFMNNGMIYITVIGDGAPTGNNIYCPAPADAYAWKDFILPEGWHEISFDWICKGEGENYDYAYFITTDIDVTITDNSPLPSSGVWRFKRMVDHETWQTYSARIPGGPFKLVFLWHNDRSVCNDPPIAIKNIKIRPYVGE